MTDRELLGLAAKAAGYKFSDLEFKDETGIQIVAPTAIANWNPMADDGDAFRLETDLSFSAIEWAGGIEVGEYEISDGKLRPVAGRTAYVKFDDHAGDKREARRLAGLRAAAEIGRAMP